MGPGRVTRPGPRGARYEKACFGGPSFYFAWSLKRVLALVETEGEGKDRKDCMRQFRAAWDHFATTRPNLTEFLKAKRKRR
jgi:hypothetical protein